MLRHRTLALLLATLATGSSLFACAAPSADDDASSSAGGLRERKIVEVEGYVEGEMVLGVAEARASFRQACDAWTAAQRAALGPTLLDVTCGEGENLTPTSSYSQYAGTVKARLVLTLEEGTAPAKSRTRVVTGQTMLGRAEASKTWSDACAAEITRAKALFGDRFAFGACTKPTNVTQGGSYTTLASDFDVLLLPVTTKVESLDAELAGEMLLDASDARDSFAVACEALGERVRTAVGDRLVSLDCGVPENRTPTGSFTTLASNAKIEVTSGGDAAPIRSAGLLASSGAVLNASDARTLLAQSCLEADAFGRELLGERFLVAACGASTNVTPTGSYTNLRANANQLVVAAGASKLEVESWTTGGMFLGSSDAEAAFDAAARQSLRASVERTGATRVEGFAVGTPENLTPTGSFTTLAAPVKVLVGVDVPEGELPPIASTDRVRGETALNTDEALASWAAACEAAQVKAKVDQGDRFLAAGCGKPVVEATSGSYTTFASDITIWLLP